MTPSKPVIPPPLPELNAKGERYTLLTARFGQCRFIDEQPYICDVPCEGSWCEYHKTKVFTPKHGSAEAKEESKAAYISSGMARTGL